MNKICFIDNEKSTKEINDLNQFIKNLPSEVQNNIFYFLRLYPVAIAFCESSKCIAEKLIKRKWNMTLDEVPWCDFIEDIVIEEIIEEIKSKKRCRFELLP